MNSLFNFFFRRIPYIYKIEGIQGVLSRIYKRLSNNFPILESKFDFSRIELLENFKKLEENNKLKIEIKTINWFLPFSESKPVGGRMTIFRFANIFKKFGIQNRFIITGNSYLRSDFALKTLKEYLSWISKNEIFIYDEKSLSDLPEADLCFATRWDTAFPLLRFHKTKRKAYFVQDFEPLLYPVGALSALAEQTYSFGFQGIVNSPILLEEYRKYSPKAIQFTPPIDSSIYYPQKTDLKNNKVRIIFYGRPQSPRNGFELGVTVLRRIKQKYDDQVEIFTVGSVWDEKKYNLQGIVKNIGFFKDLNELAATYRTCQIGLVFTFSKGFPLIGFEMMASGLALVTNASKANELVFQDKKNALLALPSASDVVEQLSALIDDRLLLKEISINGITAAHNIDIETEARHIIDFLSKPS